ncbi:RNA 2',3'-cyclic phosphodiesterase [Methanobacterium alcaliphilum]|uniref:RNA 2',3'-cyclic phosphodiesterase n=1 Tax=Methanobacterium alcaliphilum TaxID=392018 RepID=UPI00200B0238|nr:RNA 2',3'-cyclic phosphodiesterase [Methanobacterium alcaliphilum]MCK9152492.1 RNA 2',3'-cyclic phosphodiesterase [Methanobacterium alcaliphilum]
MGTNSDMRAFLAVDVDKTLLNKIGDIQNNLGAAEAPVKFVEPQNLHLTLKFFGDINEEKLNEISNIISQKVENFNPFDLLIEGVGVFPSLRYIRVIWLGTKNIDSFSDIQKELDDEFIKLGFDKERSYIPHLTIGRLKGSTNKEVLVEKIEELSDVQIGKMAVNKLILKKSELTPAGPIYTDLMVFEL